MTISSSPPASDPHCPLCVLRPHVSLERVFQKHPVRTNSDCYIRWIDEGYGTNSSTLARTAGSQP